MPAEPLHPDDRPDAAERFRADLAGYLRERSGPDLAAAAAHLARPPRRRAHSAPLAARGGRRPPGRPCRRRAGPPPGSSLQAWLASRPHGRLPATDPGRERRLGEALRGHTTQRQSRTSGRRWAGGTPAAHPAHTRPRRAGGTGGSTTTADPCPRAV
jgi:hypothetical protein